MATKLKVRRAQIPLDNIMDEIEKQPDNFALYELVEKVKGKGLKSASAKDFQNAKAGKLCKVCGGLARKGELCRACKIDKKGQKNLFRGLVNEMNKVAKKKTYAINRFTDFRASYFAGEIMRRDSGRYVSITRERVRHQNGHDEVSVFCLRASDVAIPVKVMKYDITHAKCALFLHEEVEKLFKAMAFEDKKVAKRHNKKKRVVNLLMAVFGFDDEDYLKPKMVYDEREGLVATSAIEFDYRNMKLSTFDGKNFRVERLYTDFSLFEISMINEMVAEYILERRVNNKPLKATSFGVEEG